MLWVHAAADFNAIVSKHRKAGQSSSEISKKRTKSRPHPTALFAQVFIIKVLIVGRVWLQAARPPLEDTEAPRHLRPHASPGQVCIFVPRRELERSEIGVGDRYKLNGGGAVPLADRGAQQVR
jgi:hypothetical protein